MLSDTRGTYSRIRGFTKLQEMNKDDSSPSLWTFARKFSNIDFFLKILPLKDDELVISEM